MNLIDTVKAQTQLIKDLKTMHAADQVQISDLHAQISLLTDRVVQRDTTIAQMEADQETSILEDSLALTTAIEDAQKELKDVPVAAPAPDPAPVEGEGFLGGIFK